jgi:hypothetical protein
MPSYVDFNASKRFRDFVLSKTLKAPNGPQTFNESNYSVSNLNTFANVDPGDVEDTRSPELLRSQTINTFKPIEYFINENLNTFARRANLALYPYFVSQTHNLIGIMNTSSYEDESELMKFASWYIRESEYGPVYSRLQQNLYATTYGRLRILDALEGNTTTAINILTGREPLIESNPRITVASTLVGKGIDFMQTVAGVEFPWAEIPGDYLSNPRNPVGSGNIRPEAQTEGGSASQDATGAVGSLFGIGRRPTITRKPSDLFIEYMGQRQKATLFDNLSYSKYAPNYTTTARSQNTSKIFNFVDKTAQSVKNFLGVEAPAGIAYIGDDRGNDVKNAMNIDDRPVKSSYYLSLMFDPIQATLFQRTKNIVDGGGSAGKLTWISTKSKNLLDKTKTYVGVLTNEGESTESYKRTHGISQYDDSVSTKYNFKDGSILGLTQEILETMPADGGAARSHVANVIDQTSRIFREGDTSMSRGSAIKYIDQYSGQERGVEYCRVWTKDISYMNYSDTMKKSGNYRKFESSVLTNSWNLNIYPNSNAKGEFDASSSNMAQREGGFFAKKYMFSIENLAWKTSNTPGFTYADLPCCEKGPNGGRVMWFPPYDLKVTEQNNAKWEENFFLGRPEPIYTYNNTSRSGQVSFKVIVDHPSILNLLVKKHFEGMSDAEADNYINAFFAGCQDVDFYGLVRKYTTLTPDEVKALLAYLNQSKSPQVVTRNKTIFIDPVSDTPVPKNTPSLPEFTVDCFFENDKPSVTVQQWSYSPKWITSLTAGERVISGLSGPLYSNIYYTSHYYEYLGKKDSIIEMLQKGIKDLKASTVWGNNQIHDYYLLSGQITEVNNKPSDTAFEDISACSVDTLNNEFNHMVKNFDDYVTNMTEIKSLLESDKIKQIGVRVSSSASAPDDQHSNLELAYRRSSDVLNDIIFRLCKDPDMAWNVLESIPWTYKNTSKSDARMVEPQMEIALKDLGYTTDGVLRIFETINEGETRTVLSDITSLVNIDCADGSNFLTSEELKKSAPTTFLCRNANCKIVYELKDPDDQTEKAEDADAAAQATAAQRQSVEVLDSPTGVKLAPPIDEIKKMIMKTLSECYYFKKLEEDSPLQFSSLKEKLKYFHPAFHSMTPEGLNARLTFLNQCVRPGDTLPIKGISDDRDLNARNTTFGPPPICVMRIGDFYHSKVVIRDVNITFDENIWDLNPEGIGVQPMIADVTLQISFIGGHGLERPVERLQNALSSNFYANTEMYDPRSTATEDRKEFYTKEFLDDLNQRLSSIGTNSNDLLSSTDNVIDGPYIGKPAISGYQTMGFGAGAVTTPVFGILDYTSVIDEVFSNTNQYISTFMSSYNNVLKTYDTKLGSLILHPEYRTIKDYNVQIGASTTTIELLGNYPTRKELETFALNFRNIISGKIQTENITTLIGIGSDMTAPIITRSEEILKPYVLETVVGMINDLPKNISYLKAAESARNKLIAVLDKLNFLIEYGYDGKIEKTVYTRANISEFTGSVFYQNYSNAISFIQANQSKFTEDLDTTYNFYGSTMTSDDLYYFLSILLRDKKQEILNLYQRDPFNSNIQKNIKKRLNKFFEPAPENKDFKITKYPTRKDSNTIEFGSSDPAESIITDPTVIQNLTNVHRTSGNKTTSVLNYYRLATGTGG